MKEKILEIIKNNKHPFKVKDFLNIYDEIKNITVILNKFNASRSERAYFIINELKDRPMCKECKSEYVDYISAGKYRLFCSVKCKCKNKDNKEKVKNTFLKNHGIINNFQDKNILKKALKNIKENTKKGRETYYNKTGFYSPIQNKVVKEKIKNTNLERYGVENPYQSNEIKEKIKNTNLERYGYQYYQSTNEFKQFMIENNPLHDEEIFNKSQNNRYKKKKYIFPSGRVEYVQGYEPQVINELINHFEEDDIICGKGLPEIWYKFEGGKHRYYPDIYIKSRNMIIEVKSIWTFYNDYEKNLAKANGCKQKNYSFWFSII